MSEHGYGDIEVMECYSRCPFPGCGGYRHTRRVGNSPEKVLKDCPCGGGVIRFTVNVAGSIPAEQAAVAWFDSTRRERGLVPSG